MLEPESPFEQPWHRHRLRVPREDGTLFCRPPFDEALKAVEANGDALNTSNVNVQGRTLSHLRLWTAEKALHAAAEYTGRITGTPVNVPAADNLRGFIAAGHQPSLFHAGVWAKNFAIGEMASRSGRVAINLIVDNDATAASSLRVPAGNRERPRVIDVAFDASRAAVPWEESRIRDMPLFTSFGERVAGAMARWNIAPLIAEMWPDAVAAAERTGSPAESFTAARRRLERRWGLDNLELPLSRLPSLDPFLWFACHLFAHAGRFLDVHNRALMQFRQINRVRSRTHPVPELTRRNDWIETPFWIWHERDTARRRAFVRLREREVELSDGVEFSVRLPLNEAMDACCGVEVLRELPAQGVRLRTRALTTTLFARLCLADTFVHGIGGAKYDEMTDRIIARFYGLRAPAFVAFSATAHLPLGRPFGASVSDLRRLRHQARDLRYNPDRHLPPETSPAVRAMIDEKRALIEQQLRAQTSGLSKQQRRERSRINAARYRRLRELDDSLAAYTSAEQRRVQARIDNVRQQLAADAVLRNREFSFALFPEEVLRPFFGSMVKADA
ncbi:MAG: hypothetical protein ACE5KM_05305 [Planctomycetaceae bacterium]